MKQNLSTNIKLILINIFIIKNCMGTLLKGKMNRTRILKKNKF